MRKPTHQAFSILITGTAIMAARKNGHEVSTLATIGTLAVACLIRRGSHRSTVPG